MSIFKKILTLLDKVLLFFALTMIGAMVIIIIVQVFSRQFFSYTPSWSEATSKLLFVWITFLGIAYGFREKLHIALQLVVNALPKRVQYVFDLFSKILIFGFSIAMIVYGVKFTILMGGSMVAGTGLTSSYLYAPIPVAGFFLFFYSIYLFTEKTLYDDYEELDAKELT